ncbi:MAG: hypothetical protein GX796_03555 [Clostridiaceae bacterium]|nr:hypothetical protein [Clostridiaceae bacterium]
MKRLKKQMYVPCKACPRRRAKAKSDWKQATAEGRYTVYKERSDEGNSSSTHARLAQEDEQKRSLIGSKLLLKVATLFIRSVATEEHPQ